MVARSPASRTRETFFWMAIGFALAVAFIGGTGFGWWVVLRAVR